MLYARNVAAMQLAGATTYSCSIFADSQLAAATPFPDSARKSFRTDRPRTQWHLAPASLTAV
jgi:hypothetical protein